MKQLPWVRIAVISVIGLIAVAVPFNSSVEDNVVITRIFVLAIAAMGLNLLTGYNGQISLGHGAFFGLGAFTSAILVTEHGWYVEATIPIAALTAAGLGVLVGFPALRVKGLYLALLTLGLSVLFPRVMGKFVDGPGGVPVLKLSRSDVSSLVSSLDPDQYHYLVSLGVLVVLLIVAANLIHSRAGRAMISVRDQEAAAETVGIDVSATKVITFAISAAYAGAAGALSVMTDRIADATNPLVYLQRSIEFLVAVVIGGAATLVGPILGAAFLVLIQRRFEGTDALAPALLGGALILTVYVLPDGFVGGYHRVVAWVRRRRAAPSDPTPGPAPTPDPSPT